MDSIDVSARDQVLAELAALGPVPGDALTLLVQVRQVAVFADQVLGQLARLAATGRAMAGGRVSFDAAHVICRAAGQIDDEALAAAAEKEMLAAAATGLPGSRPAAEAVSKPADKPVGAGDDQAAPEWVAPGLDPRELRRLGEDLTYRADPDAVEERQRKRFERRYLCFGLTPDDVGTISGASSDTLSMEIIKTAVEAFS
ncbi:MAG TPA: hypothetical protein VG268_07810 [Streptosporangiaceae bacterium]|nr:hypothetical protein [Streptosporangiaceae bacterium]